MSIAMRLSERTPSALRRSNPALKLEYVAIPLGEGDRRSTGYGSLDVLHRLHHTNDVVVKSLGLTTSLYLPLQNYE